MQTDVNTPALIDAADHLNCARDILSYVLEKRTPEDDEGESWILGHIEERIRRAITLLDTARQAPSGEAT